MSIEAMKQALEALEYVKQTYDEQGLVSLGTNTAIIDLRQAIAEAEKQEQKGNQLSCYCQNCEILGRELARIEKQEQGEPVALKKGECWPEEVMRQWDYWRKEIANGHKGSAPRDWFEGLSELKLIDTTPQQRTWVGLTDEDCKGMSAGDKVVAMWADRTLKGKNK